jgi:hypothetical protein
MCRQCTYRRYANTCREERLEEPPAVRRYASEVEGKLTQRKTLDGRASFRDQRFPQLPPASRSANIDECPHAGLTHVQHIPRSGGVHVGQQSNGGNSWKLSNELRQFGYRDCAATGNRDDDRSSTLGFEVLDGIIERASV